MIDREHHLRKQKAKEEIEQFFNHLCIDLQCVIKQIEYRPFMKNDTIHHSFDLIVQVDTRMEPITILLDTGVLL